MKQNLYKNYIKVDGGMRVKYVMIFLPNWCFGLLLGYGLPDLLPPTR